jgi:hypothetical protein
MKAGDLVIVNRNPAGFLLGECGVILETARKITTLPMDGPTHEVDIAMVLINGNKRVLRWDELSEVPDSC